MILCTGGGWFEDSARGFSGAWSPLQNACHRVENGGKEVRPVAADQSIWETMQFS